MLTSYHTGLRKIRQMSGQELIPVQEETVFLYIGNDFAYRLRRRIDH